MAEPMEYSTFAGTPAYSSRLSGAMIDLLFVAEDNPAEKFMIGFSGLSTNEGFEMIPIQELGNNIVEEIVAGQYTVGASVNGFWSPRYGDDFLPTTTNYIGRHYTMLVLGAEKSAMPGVVLEAYRGVRLSGVQTSVGVSGVRTFSATALGKDKVSGADFAAMMGGQSQ